MPRGHRAQRGSSPKAMAGAQPVVVYPPDEDNGRRVRIDDAH
ncbi:hypothetical protein [Streptomyces afghaniensis]|nr:hypothetical protein [Streptomyces afghaniensis]MDQ1013649.1 hypothetical protein [Streptomyces afghaniensis]